MHAHLPSQSTYLIRIYINKGKKINVLQNAIIEWRKLLIWWLYYIACNKIKSDIRTYIC